MHGRYAVVELKPTSLRMEQKYHHKTEVAANRPSYREARWDRAVKVRDYRYTLAFLPPWRLARVVFII